MRCRPCAILRATALLTAALAIVGCGKKGAGGGPRPPAVTVATPLVREVVDWDEYTGYLVSPQSVNLRARVGGEVTQVNFTEGGLVHRGDVLVRIDKRPFQADLDAKRASVEQQKAQVALELVTFQRNATAVQSNAVSKSDYDTAKANYEEALAQQRSAEAAVETSLLNLQFCDVVAPITGRISSRYVTAGNLVSGGTDSGTLLTTIQSVDPMYCYADVDERSALKYKSLAARGNGSSTAPSLYPSTAAVAGGTTAPAARPDRPAFACYMGLISDQGTPYPGQVDFINNQVDVNTGTLRIRGVFPNPSGFLEPGLFARMLVPGSGRYRATLIPDAAIGTQQNLKYVYLMSPDHKVRLTPVTPGTLFGNLRSVTAGVAAGDRVVIDGLVSVHDGAEVAPVDGTIPATDFQTVGDRSPTTRRLPATSAPSPTADLGVGAPPGTNGTDTQAAPPAGQPSTGGVGR